MTRVREKIRSSFDQAYYERFYGDARERRRYLADEARLGDFLCAYLKYMQQPVRRVVDIGCGFGHWRRIIASHFPRASYTGVERSEHLCERYGWEPGSAVDFTSSRKFDFVICKDTLQYLSARQFGAAVRNLASLSHGALYLSILTQEDWDENCDRARTDRRVHLRSGEWYRRRLAPHLINIGGGLFLSPDSPAIPWELEKLS